MDSTLDKYRSVFNKTDIGKAVDDSFPFPTFFEGQRDAIIECVDTLLNDDIDHVILEAPTGVGKTYIAFTIHRAICKLLAGQRFRTTVTTTTKTLQEQYEKEAFAYDIKAKDNYICPIGNSHYGSYDCTNACRNGDCKPNKNCPYVIRRNTWTKTSDWRVTNHAMFIKMCDVLVCTEDTQTDLLVLDECHKIPNILLDNMEIIVSPKLLTGLNVFYKGQSQSFRHINTIFEELSSMFSSMKGKLVKFPDKYVPTIECIHEEIESFREKALEQIRSERLSPELIELCLKIIEQSSIADAMYDVVVRSNVRDFLVYDIIPNESIIFKPVYPSHVSNYGLFRKASKTLHMSATICGLDAYAKLLGCVKYKTISMGHPIPKASRPINYLPVVKMTGKLTEDKISAITNAIDELIDSNKGKNGLIHTASYKLAEDIMRRSKHQKKMIIGKDRRLTLSAMDRGAKDGKGVIVLSPSMEEGVDLKYDLCRWQAIAKVPFGYLGDPLVSYMSEKDPDEYTREAILRVVQASGRVVRGVDDYGETYILDSAFGNLFSQAGTRLFPAWYKDAIIFFE